MAEAPINLVVIKFSFLGPAPQPVKDRIDSELDLMGIDRFLGINTVYWRNRLNSSRDYSRQFWDEGIAALIERLGGTESLSKLADEAEAFQRTLILQRESMARDEVDGAGAFSYESEYGSISLSRQSTDAISRLGLDVDFVYRLVSGPRD